MERLEVGTAAFRSKKFKILELMCPMTKTFFIPKSGYIKTTSNSPKWRMVHLQLTIASRKIPKFTFYCNHMHIHTVKCTKIIDCLN